MLIDVWCLIDADDTLGTLRKEEKEKEYFVHITLYHL
jgi:hypothetical protein